MSEYQFSNFDVILMHFFPYPIVVIIFLLLFRSPFLFVQLWFRILNFSWVILCSYRTKSMSSFHLDRTIFSVSMKGTQIRYIVPIGKLCGTLSLSPSLPSFLPFSVDQLLVRTRRAREIGRERDKGKVDEGTRSCNEWNALKRHLLL